MLSLLLLAALAQEPTASPEAVENAKAAGESKKDVVVLRALVGGHVAIASNADAAVNITARITTSIPVPKASGLFFLGDLDVTSLPDTAFSLADVSTFSRGVRGQFRVYWRAVKDDDTGVELGPVATWGFGTLPLNEGDVARHYARNYFAGFRFAVGSYGFHAGWGRDQIASPERRGKGQWAIGASFPIPDTGDDIVMLIDAGLNVGNDDGDPLRRDWITLNVAFDPIAALRKLNAPSGGP